MVTVVVSVTDGNARTDRARHVLQFPRLQRLRERQGRGSLLQQSLIHIALISPALGRARTNFGVVRTFRAALAGGHQLQISFQLQTIDLSMKATSSR